MNDYEHDQVFKIKSSQPEAIGVTPSAGFIRANDEIEVMICLVALNHSVYSISVLQRSARSMRFEFWAVALAA